MMISMGPNHVEAYILFIQSYVLVVLMLFLRFESLCMSQALAAKE
jgi:hypothetical protein